MHTKGSEEDTSDSAVRMWQTMEDPVFVGACDAFHATLAEGDFRGLAADKSNDMSLSDHDREVWAMMKIICFEKNAREELLTHLGFDGATIGKTAEPFMGAKPETTDGADAGAGGMPPPPSPGSADAADVFGATPPATSPSSAPDRSEPVLRALDALSLSSEAQARAEAEGMELAAAAIRAEKIEPIIRQALVVGNFAAAVDCCLEAGLMVEALLLAQCGESALWQKAQEAFFAKAKRPFLKILSTGAF